MKKAWQLTEKEFEQTLIPYRFEVGKRYISLNGKYAIEFLQKEKTGNAGLAYTWKVMINGKKKELPFNRIQVLNLELPANYNYFPVYGLVIEYAKENSLT